MSADQKAPPTVKRVAPYPIPGVVQLDGKPAKIALTYLTSRGFVARTPGLMLKVGAVYEISFEIPVLHHRVRCSVKIFKTYDRAIDRDVTAVERAAEFLFVDADPFDQKQIQRFTTAIGQKPG